MKKTATIITLTAILSTSAFAAGEDHHGSVMKGMEVKGGQNGHGQMTAMHDHMKDMKQTMAKIKSETDPKKRKKLMKQHMTSMMDGMKMMDKHMGMDMGKDKQAMMGDKGMMSRMDMMEQRMDMMHKMMSQMIVRNHL